MIVLQATALLATLATTQATPARPSDTLRATAQRSNASARRHRNVALGSIGVATIGTAMMWLWKD